eukprot:scaffold926_cov408-Prasinococcus_capsulatus_cf.AAC.47
MGMGTEALVPCVPSLAAATDAACSPLSALKHLARKLEERPVKANAIVRASTLTEPYSKQSQESAAALRPSGGANRTNSSVTGAAASGYRTPSSAAARTVHQAGRINGGSQIGRPQPLCRGRQGTEIAGKRPLKKRTSCT